MYRVNKLKKINSFVTGRTNYIQAGKLSFPKRAREGKRVHCLVKLHTCDLDQLAM